MTSSILNDRKNYVKLKNNFENWLLRKKQDSINAFTFFNQEEGFIQLSSWLKARLREESNRLFSVVVLLECNFKDFLRLALTRH